MMSPNEIASLHKAMIGNFAVGNKVRALEVLGEPASGDSPGGIYARPGEILVVRAVKSGGELPIEVAHENVIGRSFCVAVNEVEVIYE